MRIEIEDLHKSFGDLTVFDGLNLVVEQGEICVILGRSGQGKSVLLKHLVGLLRPDKGSIRIDGKDIVPLAEKELYPYRMRFGMIFQNAGLLQSLNVGENVALPLLEVRGRDYHATMKKVAESLRSVDLEGKERQPVSTLSGGQQKRVAIARALLQDADCLLFDEPTAGLDPLISKTVDDIIVQVNRGTGGTCIVVTHDLVSAFAVGTRIHLLDDGKVAASGTPEEIRNSDNDIVRRFLARSLEPEAGRAAGGANGG